MSLTLTVTWEAPDDARTAIVDYPGAVYGVTARISFYGADGSLVSCRAATESEVVQLEASRPSDLHRAAARAWEMYRFTCGCVLDGEEMRPSGVADFEDAMHGVRDALAAIPLGDPSYPIEDNEGPYWKNMYATLRAKLNVRP
jgi:hypothetical protein